MDRLDDFVQAKAKRSTHERLKKMSRSGSISGGTSTAMLLFAAEGADRLPDVEKESSADTPSSSTRTEASVSAARRPAMRRISEGGASTAASIAQEPECS